MNRQPRCVDCAPHALPTELKDGRTQFICLACGNEWLVEVDASAPLSTEIKKWGEA